MAGFNSLAAAAIGALNVANTVAKAYSSYEDNSGTRDYEQARAASELEIRQATANAEFEKEKLRTETAMAEEKRQKALRKLMAEQRAKYGSAGTGFAEGSGQAVLLGMFEESEEEKAERDTLNALKNSAIDQGVSNRAAINTLQLSQLKERNKLKKATSALGSLTSIF